MKILWIVNTIFPYPAEQIGIKKNYFGGWLNGLAENLKKNKNLKLAIATVYKGKKMLKFDDGEILYYLIPGAPAFKYDKKMKKYWKQISNLFKPDIVHIHGTEYVHGLACIKENGCKNVVVSIQGLVSRIADVYLGNIDIKDIIKNISFRDIVNRDGILQSKKNFYKRGKNEIEIIKNVNTVIGRTTWDYANVISINPKIQYFIGNETLRDVFYKNNWKLDNIEKYTLFCSQASYPIKGFHYLVQAISLLRNKYPNVKLYVAGTNILDKSNFISRIKRTGYSKYIEELIYKYKLNNNIIFTGMLNENEMLDRLLKTHVFVLPSAIENSSNSLGEAMLLGMPCVASNTGGTMDMLEHKKEGFLYPYTEPAMCAEYISRFFENDNLCIEYGQRAKMIAKKRHNQENNVDELLKIYKKVMGE